MIHDAGLEARGPSRRPLHQGRSELFQRPRADLLHGGACFLLQQVEHALDTRLAEGAETP